MWILAYRVSRKPKKGPAQRIRLYEGDAEIAAKIAAETGLDVVDVISLAASAGLKAIKANDYEMPLPLSLTVSAKPPTGLPGEPTFSRVLIEDRKTSYKTKKGEK